VKYIAPSRLITTSVGGRGTQSELYRVTYTGKDSTQPAPADSTTDSNAGLRQLRRKLEAFHHKGSASGKDLQAILDQLGHADRFIRYAARVALENQPAEL